MNQKGEPKGTADCVKTPKSHNERSEATREVLETLDCFVADAPRNDGIERFDTA